MSAAVDFKSPPRVANDPSPPTKRKKVKASFSLSLAIVRTVAVGAMVFGAFVAAAGVYFFLAKNGLKVPDIAGNKIATDPKGGILLMGIGANAIAVGALLNLPYLGVKAARETSAATSLMAELMQDRMEARR